MTDWLTFVSFEHFLPLSFIRFMQESPPPQGGGLFRFPKPLPRGEGGPRRGSGEEFGRQTNDLKQPADLHQGPITNLRISLNAFTNFQVTARIPHQSKIGSEEPIFAS